MDPRLVRRTLVTSALAFFLGLLALAGAFLGRPDGRWDGFSVGLLLVALALFGLAAAGPVALRREGAKGTKTRSR